MHSAAVFSGPAETMEVPFFVERASRFAVFDNPDAWADFSRRLNGDEASGGRWESQLAVQGMHCAACALKVEQLLLGIEGVLSVRVSAGSQQASIEWSDTFTRPSEWMAAAEARGYFLLPAADAFAADPVRKDARLALWRWLVAGFCMMQVMMYAFPAYIATPGAITPDIEKLLRWASWVLTLPVVLFSCGPFFRNALRDLRHRSISMDLPVALGIAVTFVVSSAATFDPGSWWGREVYFDSLTMFVFFLLTGRWLEQLLRQRTAGSLGVLMQRLPASVERQLADGSFERVAVRQLKPGDMVRVLPGDAFPADGTVITGDSSVDEALLTGESRPVPRQVGSAVMAGSYNLSAPVMVRIEQTGKATRYAQIVALMESAAVDKPRLAILADRVAKPFVIFVLVAACMAAAFWWSTDPAKALMAAVAVLIVTCPCALSLATPAAMLASAGRLARQGVLVRRLQSLEALASIDTVVFDKTGTLTEARMALKGVVTRPGLTSSAALQLAKALALHSLHPVSRAIVAAADAHASGTSPDLADGYIAAAAPELVDVKEVAGLGIEGRFAAPSRHACRGPLRLGSVRFCETASKPFDHGNSGSSQEDGASYMQLYLSDEAGLLARFDLEEVIRPDAARVVQALRESGILVEMLSGDRKASVLHVAERVGITSLQGDCSPQTKLAHLKELQQQGGRVLMVGDGLNDGPVLAAANASIALGNAVPLAQAQSDLVMPGGQLHLLPDLLLQARSTMSVVRQNLWWAAGYNAVCVPVALVGWMPAWLAGLGMALSSLLVIANAARLARMPRVVGVG